MRAVELHMVTWKMLEHTEKRQVTKYSQAFHESRSDLCLAHLCAPPAGTEWVLSKHLLED